MKPKVKPQTSWAIVNREGDILTAGLFKTEKACIDGWVGGCTYGWSEWESWGYRCVKVNIVPVDE